MSRKSKWATKFHLLFVDLDKMRENKFHKMASEVFQKLQGYSTLTTDQGIFNIIFARFPEKLLDLPRQFNWIRGSCAGLTKLDSEIMTPISNIHGTSGIFHSNHGIKWNFFQMFNNLKRLFVFAIDTDLPKLDIRPVPAVIYPCAFQTFQKIEISKILSGSQNISQIFQANINMQSGLLYDPCKIVLPQILHRFNLLVN